MPLDDFIYRLKPESGDSAPHDELGVGANLSGGTITLVDRGGGDFAWQFASGQASAAIPSYSSVGANAGGGITWAVTLAVTNYGNTDFTFFTGIGPDALASATTSNGIHIGRTTANNLRARQITNSTTTIGAVGTTERTYVVRQKNNVSGGSDRIEVWIDTVGRVGTAADFVNGADFAAGTVAYDTVVVNGVNNAVLQVKDLVVWHEELTDAECAALADDLRGELDAGGPVALTPEDVDVILDIEDPAVTFNAASGTTLTPQDVTIVLDIEEPSLVSHLLLTPEDVVIVIDIQSPRINIPGGSAGDIIFRRRRR